MKEMKMGKVQDKREIKKMKEDLLLATQQCIACEFCVPSCPLYSGWLTDSATGRMQSLHYAVKKGWDLDDRLRSILYSCTLCGACELKCKNLSQSVEGSGYNKEGASTVYQGRKRSDACSSTDD